MTFPTGKGKGVGGPPDPLSTDAPAAPPTPESSDDGMMLGPPDAATDALAAAFNEPIVSYMVSGVLSAGFSNGIADAFSTAEGGWNVGAQATDTAASSAAEGGFSAFVGQSVEPYTNMPADGANPNSFITGQDINPSTGSQNAEPFSGGAAPTQSPSATSSGWAAFGYNGPPPSDLSSPDLTAFNNAAPSSANIASDAVPNYSGSGNGAELNYVNSTTVNGVNLNVYANSEGLTAIVAPGTTGGNIMQFVGTPDILASAASPAPSLAPSTPDATATTPSPDQAATPPMPAADPTAAAAPSPTTTQVSAPPSAPPSPPPDPPPAPPAQSQIQQASPPDSPTQESISQQQQEENWSAAKAGMWDSFVNLAAGLLFMGVNPLARPQLDWAKFGPPASTGEAGRDADLLDNYQSGGLFTTTISLAAPFATEGLLGSALSASTKLPALEGIGMGGGGRLIGATEQWLSAFGETTEALRPELPTLAPQAEGAVAPTGAYQVIMSTKLKQAAADLGQLGYTTSEIRAWHFYEATNPLNPESIPAQLNALIASDPEAAQALIDEINNNNVVLHHSTEEGVMELVYKSEHTSPEFSDLFHPGGKGGMSRWGRGFGGP
jgi:hypothetical protein